MSTLRLWQRFAALPCGKWMFSRIVCAKAPYFGSIGPRIMALAPGRCEVAVRKRRAVQNHLGTVHAIALCNMAELAGGLMTEVTIPATHRWIPKGMTVEYLKKAMSDVRAVATPVAEADWGRAGEYKVKVEVHDVSGQLVFRAVIAMWVSPKA